MVRIRVANFEYKLFRWIDIRYVTYSRFLMYYLGPIL